MRVGYMRLQALIRARVLSHRFRHLRGHVVALQARARGYLVRRMFRTKMWAIVKIQAHVRRMIAQKRYKKIKVGVLTEKVKIMKHRIVFVFISEKNIHKQDEFISGVSANSFKNLHIFTQL